MPRIIPEAGKLPNAEADALEVFKVLKAGGIAIVPTEVGYGIVAASSEGIERAFTAKQRKPGHTLGIIGTYDAHRQLHDLPDEKFEISRVMTQEMGSLLAVIAPYRREHERLQCLSPETLSRVTKDGTMGIAITEGPFQHALGKLNDDDGQLMIGSSANLTGQGQKFRVEDIEDEVKHCAELIVDYGLQRYHSYGRAGTNIDLQNMKVLRMGAGYEVFAARMWKWFNIALPDDAELTPLAEAKSVGVSVKLEN